MNKNVLIENWMIGYTIIYLFLFNHSVFQVKHFFNGLFSKPETNKKNHNQTEKKTQTESAV